MEVPSRFCGISKMNYLIIGLILCVVLLMEPCYAAVFTDTWAVRIDGGEEVAKRIAEERGFTYLGKIMDNHYHLRHHHVAKRSLRHSAPHHELLSNEPQVKWFEQQVVKRRVKRDVMWNDPKWPRMWYLDYEEAERHRKKSHNPFYSPRHQQVGIPSLNSRSRRDGGLDMNVKPAWKKGYTGRNVVVSILDDGIEKDHPDLKKNYDPMASYDVNGHDADPQPRYDYTNENRHGTRCAGEVAAEANNGICSVGVAYEARIGGVRMLDGDVTDAVEAQSLSLNPQHIDIYSASWGPDDDGRTVDGPAILAKRAFLDGIRKGRGGKGSIFVWASGNGGREADSCNCDGYTNSIYTLSISSATENGNIPWYSEACSSTLATTYSSGSGGERQIVTTDLRKSCTENHTGTSASAPLAAGICALALEARMDMTWRDMQHIVVMTARPANLKASDWVTNAVGRRVSHSFGFGLMDAEGMVELARNWTNVPKAQRCAISYKGPARTIKLRSKIEVYIDSDGCQNSARDKVIFLEHVQAIITLSSSRRGEVQIFLTSPHGTKSTLLQRRHRDTSTEGFSNWAFMTTHNWGETSKGRWTLTIENGDSRFGPARLREWSLVMYGTDRHPYAPTTLAPTTTPIPTTPKPTTRRPTAPHRRVPYLRSRGRSHPTHQPISKSYSGQIIQVGPCRKPESTTERPTTTTTSTTAATTTTATVSPISTSILSPNTTAQLKAWTLVMYGTATHPQSGRSHHTGTSRSQSTMPDCEKGQYLLNNFCYPICPLSFYPTTQNFTNDEALSSTNSTSTGTTPSEPAVRAVPVCEQCHLFCTKCSGPAFNDCLACANGFEHYSSSNTCHRKTERTGPAREKLLPWLTAFIVVFVAASLVISIVVFVVLQLRDHKKSCWRKQVQYVDLDKGQYGLLNNDTEESSEEDESFTDIRVRTLENGTAASREPNESREVIEEEY